jgi:hypothetical protein
MCWSRRLLLCCLLVTSPLLAQTGTPAAAGGSPWLLLLALQSDEDAYQNLSAIFHLGLADATWLSLAAGTSKAPDTEPDIRAGRAGIGIEHDFGPVGLRVNAERWGDSGNLETRDWLGELFLRRDRYRLGISYIRREIDIYFSGETLRAIDGVVARGGVATLIQDGLHVLRVDDWVDGVVVDGRRGIHTGIIAAAGGRKRQYDGGCLDLPRSRNHGNPTGAGGALARGIASKISARRETV